MRLREFDEIAAAQGWSHESVETVLMAFITDRELEVELVEFAEQQAQAENEEEATGESDS